MIWKEHKWNIKNKQNFYKEKRKLIKTCGMVGRMTVFSAGTGRTGITGTVGEEGGTASVG